MLAAAPMGCRAVGQEQEGELRPQQYPVLTIKVPFTLGRQSIATILTSLRSVISFCTSLLGAVWTFTLASRADSSFLRLSTFLRA